MSRARLLDEPVALLDVNVLVALFDPDHVHPSSRTTGLPITGPPAGPRAR